MIVINEELVGKQLDKDGITSNQEPVKYAKILVKYYQHQGLTKDEIEQKLLERINISCDSKGVIKDYVISCVMSNIHYHGKFRDGVIPISLNELEAIRSLGNIDLEKFMFSFLVLYKSFTTGVKYKKQPFLKYSMLSGNSRYYDKCFSELYHDGYVMCKEQKRKFRNQEIYETVNVLGKDFPAFDESQVALTVHDTNTPVLYYLMYCGICDVQFCEQCGQPYIKSKHQNRGRNLCKDCQYINKKEYDKNRRRKLSQKSILKIVEDIR